MAHRLRFLAALLAALAGTAAWAAPAPGMLTYSGHLKRSDGTPETSPASLQFRIYDVPSGGAPLWAETVPVEPAADGWFAAVLGLGAPFPPLDWETDLYLGIAFESEAEMAPRLRLTSAARAMGTSWARVSGFPVPCGAGQFLRGYQADGGPVCGDDLGGTAYAAGSGLRLTGNTFSLDSTGCAPGQVQKWNGSAWACAGDADTMYSAGTGLALSGTTFSVASSGCTGGQVLKWSGSAWGCAPDLDTNSGGTITGVVAGSGLLGGGSSGSVSLSASFGGTGSAGTVARSDHTHSSYAPYSGGNVTIPGDFGYSSARTGYVSISALAFAGTGLVTHTGFGETYLAPGVPEAWGLAQVQLPGGATITEFRCTLIDNDVGSMNMALRRNAGFPSDSALASVDTVGLANSASVRVLSTTTISTPVVDNANWSYYAVVYLTGTSNTRDLSFNGCRITYTRTALSP
jgi:hypothetical protein